MRSLLRQERIFIAVAVARILAERRGMMVSFGEICLEVWRGSHEPDGAPTSISLAVKRLRKEGFAIEVHRTRGYIHR